MGDVVSAAFVCPRCGTQSWNLNDRKHGYCARCRDFTAADQPVPFICQRCGVQVYRYPGGEWPDDQMCLDCSFWTRVASSREGP